MFIVLLFLPFIAFCKICGNIYEHLDAMHVVTVKQISNSKEFHMLAPIFTLSFAPIRPNFSRTHFFPVFANFPPDFLSLICLLSDKHFIKFVATTSNCHQHIRPHLNHIKILVAFYSVLKCSFFTQHWYE